MNDQKKINKLIGIVGWKTGDNSLGITLPYAKFFQQYGNIVVVNPTNEDIIPNLDLLVLPGGLDVNPTRYGRHASLFTSLPNVLLETFDTYTLPKYIEAQVPIFGICRGLQTLNVHFGGTLIQHMYDHPTSPSDERDKNAHIVAFVKKDENENTYTTLDKPYDNINMYFAVNSLHHQCIGALGKGIIPVLRTYMKKTKQAPALVDNFEAIKHETLPIIAVQYHPEEIYDPYSDHAIKSLLKLQ